MVPDSAEATLSGEPAALLRAASQLGKFWDRNVSHEVSESGIHVRAVGKSAHGARPSAGDNAVARLARALCTLDLAEEAIWAQWAVETVDTTGAALGIARTDDVAGPLTCNLGIMEYTERNTVRLTYNIRYPVTWNIADLLETHRPVREAQGWEMAEHHDQAPLYVPLDKEPVSTLLRVYQEETGDTTTKPASPAAAPTRARHAQHRGLRCGAFPAARTAPPTSRTSGSPSRRSSRRQRSTRTRFTSLQSDEVMLRRNRSHGAATTGSKNSEERYAGQSSKAYSMSRDIGHTGTGSFCRVGSKAMCFSGVRRDAILGNGGHESEATQCHL